MADRTQAEGYTPPQLTVIGALAKDTLGLEWLRGATYTDGKSYS